MSEVYFQQPFYLEIRIKEIFYVGRNTDYDLTFYIV